MTDSQVPLSLQSLEIPLSPELPSSEAIPELVKRFGGSLYQLGLRVCGSHQEAQDLVQDTFLLAFQHWTQFRGESSAKTWLYTIASRVCQRRKRLRSGEPKDLESVDELIPASGDRIPDVWNITGPLEQSIQNQGKELLSAAISELPIDFRMPLILKDIAELSVRDVAEVLDLKEATVKTRVHRARLHLRRVLAENLPEKNNACVSDRQICLDLVHAKLNAMDKGVPYVVADDVICQRCESLFATLDLTQEACQAIGRGAMPESLYDQLKGLKLAS